MREDIWAVNSGAKSSSEKCVMTEQQREWQLQRSGNNMFCAALCIFQITKCIFQIANVFVVKLKFQNVFSKSSKCMWQLERTGNNMFCAAHCVFTAKNSCKGCADIFRPRFVPFLATGGQVRSTACQATTNNEILLLWSLISNGLLLKDEECITGSCQHICSVEEEVRQMWHFELLFQKLKEIFKRHVTNFNMLSLSPWSSPPQSLSQSSKGERERLTRAPRRLLEWLSCRLALISYFAWKLLGWPHCDSWSFLLLTGLCPQVDGVMADSVAIPPHTDFFFYNKLASLVLR